MEDLQDRLEVLFNKGHKDEISSFFSKIEDRAELNSELQEKLDALGDNPASEQKVFNAIEDSKTEGKLVVAKSILQNSDIKKFSAEEIGSFIYAVEQKITGFRLDDGTFKSTANTENCNLPNFEEAEEIIGFREKEEKLREDVGSASKKDKEKAIKKLTSFLEDMEARLFEISGLEKEDLSDWEQSLIMQMLVVSSINARLSSMGKPLRI